jgi:hypothetical protein
MGKKLRNFLLCSLAVACLASCNSSNNKNNQKSITPPIVDSTNTTTLPEKDIAQSYFPLDIGDSWTYRKTMINPKNILHYCEMVPLMSTGNISKGSRYLSVSKSLFLTKPGVYEERYTIVGKDVGIFFKVKVDGDFPRDGRYNRTGPEEVLNVRWGYTGKGEVWETMDGTYQGIKIRKEALSALLTAGTGVGSPANSGGFPSWIITSEIYKGSVKVPAGIFSDCLENIVLVGVKNFKEALSGQEIPEYPDRGEFGGFMTKSVYARDVGLVKEFQFDEDNNLTYVLELTGFHVK